MDTQDCAFKSFSQIGIVVKDINRAVQDYESLGFGPFQMLPPGI